MTNATSGGADTSQTWWKQHSDAVVVGLLTTIICGGGTFLWSLHGQVSAMDARMEASDARIDRIASTLPDIGIRVATEDLFRQYDYAAVQVAITELRDKLIILDLKRNTQETWRAPPEVSNPSLVEAAISGVVVASSKTAYSFADLSSAAGQIGTPMPAPATVIPASSWAAIGTPQALETQLNDIGWEKIDASPIQTAGKTHYEGILERAAEVIEAAAPR